MSSSQEKTASRILIVDDDVDLLMLLERILLKQGYEVETAATLREAEEVLLYFAPHLVLLDINIQGEDGRQLCWKLKHSIQHFCRVIIMSGYDGSMSRAALFGADDLLVKPFHTDFLIQRIELQLHPESESTIAHLLPSIGAAQGSWFLRQ